MAYEIPPEVPHFVDREGQQALAFQAVAERGEQHGPTSRPLCLALSGLAGVGKTELGLLIARAQRQHYPDDTLYVDLDDLRRDGAVDVLDALGMLLRGLRVEPEQWGLAFQDRCRAYWSRTDGKRLIVIVDNVRYGSEAVPLLPASGASLVIMMSHGPLHDLEHGATVPLPLDPLDDDDARELLTRLVDPGDRRLSAEPEAVTGLVHLCSGLPAAVRVAGHWMRKHGRRPLSRLLAELTTELQGKGLPVVERVWDAAYRELTPDAALLYRSLPLAPGPTFSPESAAALLDRGRDAADDALDELEAAGLLDTRDVLHTRDGRMRLPGLLRAHAERRARQDGNAQESGDTRTRIVRWYLRQAQRADALAAGSRLTVAGLVPPLPSAPDVQFERAAQAYHWLENERHALYGCVRLAYASGADAEVVALCEPLWTHFLDHPHHADTVDAFGTGVASAQRAGLLPALVRMRCQRARPLWEQERFEEAANELDQAGGAAEALPATFGDRDKLRASVMEFRGMLLSAQGDWAGAAELFRASRETHRAIPNPYGVMLQTYRLGQATAELGRLEQAAELLEEAHATAAALDRARMTARTGFALAGVLRRIGQPARARELYLESLGSARARGSGQDEARTLDALAALAQEDGNEAEAREHREAARAARERNTADEGAG
ncbi:hypothetical protein LHJ74_12900 [Streptomyces sp. N2-109]|uniref:AAA+ ATPase domain-containing protein n=1 Tax=Streptomyces gossypii TaxID=2883101 RepID=A0ABT2JU34_9ACTN|nr:hypothetical protein [Streptomyces gossypii]MCT2590799.1 hypothetical protein [Streptomyces gossypii]